MTRVARRIIAILAFAVAAGAEDPSPEPPSIRLTTLPNPVTDEIAIAPRRAGGTVETLSGVFAVRDPESSISYAWDPAACRMMFSERGADLIFIAEGPSPAAATVGAYGPPRFFGYRIVENGVPEFLYTQGRLGIEEQIRPAADGKSLTQRFRIENADHGLIFAVPPRWKDRVKCSAGDWKGDFLNLSKTEAKKGFVLTYDLSQAPELPDLPKNWNAGPFFLDAHAPPIGLPTCFRAAPGWSIERFEVPANLPIASLAKLDDGRLLAATVRGDLLLARETIVEPGRVTRLNWSPFSNIALPQSAILDSSEMPDSVLVSHAYGSARLFDTDKDGKADFFKAVPDGGVDLRLPDAGSFPVDGWDLFAMSLKQPAGDSSTTLRFTPLGLNPDELPIPPLDRHSIQVPRLTCSAPSLPLIRGDGENARATLILADRANSAAWRFARILPDRSGNTLQGATYDFPVAAFASAGLEKVILADSGDAFWGLPKNGGCLLRICRDDSPRFEVESVHLAADAFEITFSQPIDRKLATDLSNLRVRAADPRKHGPEIPRPVEAAIVDSDGMTLALRVPGLAPGELVEFNLLRLRSESGVPLSHGLVYYSANSVPAFPSPEVVPDQPGSSTELEPETEPESGVSAESSRDSKAGETSGAEP